MTFDFQSSEDSTRCIFEDDLARLVSLVGAAEGVIFSIDRAIGIADALSVVTTVMPPGCSDHQVVSEIQRIASTVRREIIRKWSDSSTFGAYSCRLGSSESGSRYCLTIVLAIRGPNSRWAVPRVAIAIVVPADGPAEAQAKLALLHGAQW